MKAADIRVGEQYALREHCTRGRRRKVTVVAPARKGHVTVRAEADLEISYLPPGDEAFGHQPAGTVFTTTTRMLEGPWEECAGRERAELEAATPRPGRSVAELDAGAYADLARRTYAEQLEAALGRDVPYDTAHARATRAQEARAALGGLPLTVQRDLVGAVLAGRAPAVHGEGSVAVALSRAAAAVRGLLVGYERFLRPDSCIADHDDEFVAACTTAMSGRYGDVHVPPVPPVRVPLGAGTSRPVLGWVRVAASEGQRCLHGPRCRNPGPVEAADYRTVPLWWARAVASNCHMCRGPVVVSTPAWARFRVASDVWAATGGPAHEWQQSAVHHLLSEASAARAAEGEPDTLLAATVLEALADEPPDGLYAHAARVPGHAYTAAPGEEEDASVAWTRSRLRAAIAALPPGARPDHTVVGAGPDGLVRMADRVANAAGLPRPEASLFVLVRTYGGGNDGPMWPTTMRRW